MERMQDNINKLEQALVELHASHIAQDHARAQTIVNTKTVTHQLAGSKIPNNFSSDQAGLNQAGVNPQVIDLLQKSLNRSETDRTYEVKRADTLQSQNDRLITALKAQESNYHELTNVILNQLEGSSNDQRILQSIRSFVSGGNKQNPVGHALLSQLRRDLGQSNQTQGSYEGATSKNNLLNSDIGFGNSSDELIHQKVKNYTRHILNDKDVSITPNLVHSAAQEIAKKLHNDNNLTVQSAERAEIPLGSIASAVQNKIDSVKQDLLDLNNGF